MKRALITGINGMDGSHLADLLLKKGYEVLIISDAMGSRNNSDHEIALQRMLHKGAIITTTESIIFEICKTSDRKEFEEIRNIIKN